ncbi:MAG: DEAD/DEAH box helicase family protein, partial [Butyrivibrio sp.]|nr:DEAD/DEAH box helicase family protein [Butyrivibrio sp.]
MRSNFAFLEKYWPVLAQIANMAENYLYSDPNTCMYKLGMFAERLVQEMMVFEGFSEPDDDTQSNRIRMLKRAGLLPTDIDNTLYVLRKNRNDAVHSGADSLDDAKMLLSMAYNLAVWFMQTYGDWSFNPELFILPEENDPSTMKKVLEEQEKRIAELTQKLEEVKTAASGTTQKERVKRGLSVSAMMEWSEAQTRCLIDEQLRKAGWEADTNNLRYSKGTRPEKGRNIVISEWPTDSRMCSKGSADYAFFIGEKIVAIMDAKKMEEDVASTIDVQVKDYAKSIKNEHSKYVMEKWGKYQVPFLFASNGRAFLEQIRTKSGIWFLDVRNDTNQSYPIRNWFSPSDIEEKLQQDVDKANKTLTDADNSFMEDKAGLNLRDYQIKAIEKVTEAIIAGKKAALLAMATGTGKTRTVLGLIYKMLESRRFRRILFLVDRVTLG